MIRYNKTSLVTIAVFTVMASAALASSAAFRETAFERFDSVREFLGISGPLRAMSAERDTRQTTVDDAPTTLNGTLTFGNTADGTTATTGNTGFGGVRVGTGGGGFTIQNPGQTIGSQAELRGIAPTGGSINSVGVTSTEYGTAAQVFTVSFEIYLSGGSSGMWYFFAGNGTTFDSAQSATFTGSQVFTGLRFAFGASNTITTNNRNAGAWDATGISGTPFAQNSAYKVFITGNNSASTVNYGNGQSVAANKYDLWVNGVLVGDDLGKAQLAAATNVNAFRFYGESSAGNVANIALDNIAWWNEAVAPAPTTQASNITFSSVSSTSMTVNWTNGNGSKRIVKMNTSNSFSAPVDGTDPSANTVYGGSGEQVVYNGSGSSVAITGLTAGTTYWFRVYEANGSGSTITYNTATATNNPLSQTTAFPPTLGTYGNTSLALSGNATVTPSAAPANTTTINASTNSNFKGTLTADPVTGVVRVSDAHPAGTYPVTVTAFGPGGSATASFTLTVTSGTPCGGASSFSFAPATTASIGSVTVPRGVAVGDINGDGFQDVVTANVGSNNISVVLGDGAGGFGAAAIYSTGPSSGPAGVALGDMDGNGTLDVLTAGSGTGNVSIHPGDGLGGFGLRAAHAVGTAPTSVVVGDFNGDGKADFATANSGSGNVSVRLGNGTGGFASVVNYAVGTSPITVATGDFNGDGKQDLVTSNFSSANVSVLAGNGLGGFAAAVNYSAGTSPISVAAGDLDGDGNLDLAVANQGGIPGVSVLPGSGTGTFGLPTSYPGGVLPAAVAFGDFNNDGKSDVAAGDQNGPTVPILLGDGTGGFEYTRNFTVGTSPRSIAVADLNGDGRQDIVSGNYGSNNISILLGTCITPEANVKGNDISIADGDTSPDPGDDTDFGSTPVMTAVTRTFAIENIGTGDLYLTQANKVSITGANADQFQLLTPPSAFVVGPSGSLTFQVRFIPTSPGSKSATISFGNNDTDENPYDFAIQGVGTASYTVTYNGNGSTGGTAPTDPNSPYTFPASVTVLGNTGTLVRTNYTFAGWNTQADGLGTTYQPNDTFSIAEDTIFYALWTPIPPTLGTYSNSSIVMSDNGIILPAADPGFTTSITARTRTGFKGTLTANPVNGAVTVTNAYPAGTYPVTVTAFGLGGSVSTTFNLTVTPAGCGGTPGLGGLTNTAAGTAPSSVTVGDINGDGVQDIVTANSGSSNTSVLNGTGSGTLFTALNSTVASTPQSGAVGDFNGDGRQDLVTANNGANSVSVLLGNGVGPFAPRTDISLLGQSPYTIAVTDLNGDGKQDVVTANLTGSASILLGDGTGSFTLNNIALVGAVPVSIAAGDFNGDGKTDLAVAHSTAGFVSIIPGNGDGTFGIISTYASGAFSVSVAVGDVNGDGKQDLAVANSSANTVSVLIGDGSGGFGAATPFSVGTTPAHVAAADLNGDGNLDLLSANSGSNNISVLTGNGSGGFAAAVNYGVGSGPYAVAVGDLNGDGLQDIAVANSSSNNVTVRLGTCVTSVIYNGNGSDSGSVPVDPASYPVGSTVTVLGNVGGLSRNGYDFSGWNTAANGSGTTYAPSSTFTINANTTLYARWTPKQYTLTYNGNGNTGGTAPSPVTQDYNTTVAAAGPGTLVRSGYTFTGWNTAANGSGNAYAVGAPFTFTASTTLYAQWIAAPTITLDTAALAFGNGNTGFGSAPQSKAISGANLTGDITCSAPADFQVSSNGTSWGSTAIFTQSGGSASGTLRTRFNPGSTGVKSGSVSCTSNFASTQSFTAGGTGFNPQYRGGRIAWQKSGIANITFTAEAAFRTSDFGTVAINDLVDVGADLDYGDGTALEDVRLKVTSINAGEGWFYGTLVKAGGAALTYTYPTANATYKAVWKGTGRLAAASNFSTSDWRSAADVKIETTVTTTNSSRSTVTPVLYVQDNSIVSFMLPITSFDGYTTTAAVGTAGDFVANPAVPSAQVVPPGLTVGANGLINWDVRDSVQAGVASGQIYYLAVTLDNGHGTVSPVEVMVSVTPAAVLNLDLTALDFGSVTVGANSAGQTKAISGSNLPADILCQSTPDYQVSSNGTVWNNFATFTQSGGNASGTLYTRFSPTSGGSIPGQVQCSSGTAAVKTFETGGIGVAPSYTVTFNSNGGSGTMAPQTANTPTPLNANAFMRTGYTFAGWGTSPGGPAILGNGVTYSFTANITLYAQWTINQYTLTYNGNGNTGGAAPGAVTQNYNTSVSVAGAGTLTRAGYTFGGWNTADDGSGTGYAPSSTFTFPAANTTLYAVWAPITYQLTVNAGAGGSINEPGTSPATVDHGSPTTIIAVANVGYTFTNWTVTAGSASIANPSSAVTTVTLTAGNAAVQANFAPLTTVQLGTAGSFIGVEGSTAAVTVTRTGVTTGTSTVQYSLSGGTATAGTCGVGSADYVAASGTLTFGPSETTKTVNVTLCGDAVTESPDETIGVTISSPTGAVLGTPATGSVRIIDTDADYLNTGQINTTAGGTASTYPLPITVASYPGGITGLSLSIFAITQNVPDDIDILLVSPDGTRKMVIMSYAGGSQPLSSVSFKFADIAAGFVPDPGPITDGAVYKPTNCVASVPDFPAPAPPGPYSEPGCSGSPAATFASVFGGMDPNGIWKVYIRDHSTPLSPLSGSGYLFGAGIRFILAPTAGEVAVAGRVMTADGTGIRNARVTVSGGDLAQPLTAVTGAFGNYRVEGLTAGETYVVTVASKSYVFEAPSRIVTLGDSVAGLDFTARP